MNDTLEWGRREMTLRISTALITGKNHTYRLVIENDKHMHAEMYSWRIMNSGSEVARGEAATYEGAQKIATTVVTLFDADLGE